MSNRVNILKRKQKGKVIKSYYQNLFSIFNSSEFIDLEETDLIITRMRQNLMNIKAKNEFIETNMEFIESDLMRRIYLKLTENDQCYIFSDEYEYCGMYLINSKRAFEKFLRITVQSTNGTAFLMDKNLNYFFRINYHDHLDDEVPNKFDIQKRVKVED
jgi:hypothetical protein